MFEFTLRIKFYVAVTFKCSFSFHIPPNTSSHYTCSSSYKDSKGVHYSMHCIAYVMVSAYVCLYVCVCIYVSA